MNLNYMNDNEPKINLENITEEEVTLKKQDSEFEEEIKKLKNDLLMALAEIQNLSKRHEKEKGDLQKFALSSALSALSVPFEHLFSALKIEAPKDLEGHPFIISLIKGTEMVKTEFEKVFNTLGLKRIYPEGEEFNYNLHQAVSQIQDETKKDGIVASVISAGFELNGRLIKPALVVVVKNA